MVLLSEYFDGFALADRNPLNAHTVVWCTAIFLLARLYSYSHDDLAEIPPVQHPDQCFGRFLQTVDNILAIADPAIGDRCSNFAQEIRVMLASKFVVDESAQCQALAQNLAHGGRKSIRAVAGRRPIVLRDEAADRHPREVVEQRQHRLPDSSADIFEVEFIPHEVAFLRAAGDTDRPCARELRELSDQ